MIDAMLFSIIRIIIYVGGFCFDHCICPQIDDGVQEEKESDEE